MMKDKSYLGLRFIISGLGVLSVITVFPFLKLMERFYELSDIFVLGENFFAVFGFVIVLSLFLFLYKNGYKFFSAILFSIVYYFFIPVGVGQLLCYDVADGQVAFALFPIGIICSILLFFVFGLFEKSE